MKFILKECIHPSVRPFILLSLHTCEECTICNVHRIRVFGDKSDDWSYLYASNHEMKNAMQKCPKYPSTHSIELNGLHVRFHAGFGKSRWKINWHHFNISTTNIDVAWIHQNISTSKTLSSVAFLARKLPFEMQKNEKKTRKSIQIYQNELNQSFIREKSLERIFKVIQTDETAFSADMSRWNFIQAKATTTAQTKCPLEQNSCAHCKMLKPWMCWSFIRMAFGKHWSYSRAWNMV